MSGTAIKVTKKGPKATITPPQRANFALGTRPPALRSPAMQRVKPALSQREYGKAGADNPPNPGGAGPGDTGQAGWF